MNEYAAYLVYLKADVSCSLVQIIEAGLTHLEVEYDQETFEVDYQGVQ